jgi:purine-nucleoside phosphorylase
VRTIVLTNAAGGVNTAFTPGSLMVITDHVSVLGESPLRGVNDDHFGPRFPDMSDVYSPALQDIAIGEAHTMGIELRRGVYMAFSGPSYETPAEIRMARTMGADAVGMSTALEVIAARHMGVRVVGLSLITNIVVTDASDDERAHDPGDTLHVEVTAQGASASKRLADVIVEVVRAVSRPG